MRLSRWKSLMLIPLVALTAVVASATTTSANRSADSQCLSYWPDNARWGRVELTYDIGEECRPINFHIVESVPKELFTELAICMVEIPEPVMPSINFPSTDDAPEEDRRLTEDEYRRLVTEYQNENPDKYYERRIGVKMRDDSPALVKCYFDKDWNRTGAEITVTVENRVDTQPLYDFSMLPTQTNKREFWDRR